MYKYIFLILIVLSGCNLKVNNTDNKTIVNKEVSVESSNISKSMSGISEENCKLMYKQFMGLSLYLKNSNSRLSTTNDILKTISEFQKDYGYTISNSEYTDAVELYLIKKGYPKEGSSPKKIVEIVSDTSTEKSKSEVISDMEELAIAAKLAIKAKNGN